MKKIIVGIVCIVIIISGIICFKCIKTSNVEKKASLDVSSVQKNGKIEKKKQKQKEQSSDTKEEKNIQTEVNKDNNKVSKKNEIIQKNNKSNNSSNQEKKSSGGNSNSSTNENKGTNNSQSNQPNNVETTQPESKKDNSNTTEVGPVQNIVNDNNSQTTEEGYQIDYYRENGIIKEFSSHEECQKKEIDYLFSDTGNLINASCVLRSNGNEVIEIRRKK